MKLLSILIVNWNSKDYLRRCLQSVEATCADLAPQVVVVDGGSFDGCAEMLSEEFPDVDFVQSPSNIGFGRSNNLAFQLAKGEYVMLLNPDTELTQGAVSTLLAQLRELPKAGLVAPRLLLSDGTLQASSVRRLPTPLKRAVDSDFLRRLLPRWRVWGTYEAYHSHAPVQVEAVSGACMLLKRDTFRRVGGFSHEFFMYGEDMDLCTKLRRFDLAVYHVPGAEVIHHGGGSSSGQFNLFETVMILESGAVYMRRNHGSVSALVYRWLQFAAASCRLTLLLPCLVLSRGSTRDKHRQRFLKWRSVLRWCLGGEKWIRQYRGQVPVSPVSGRAGIVPVCTGGSAPHDSLNTAE